MYAAARGWTNNKMAAMSAFGLPDDKVEFLLTMREEDRKDWSKLKKAILTEYRTDEATAEQAFLTRNRQPGESFLVYSAVLERLYCQAFKLEPETDLSEPSKKAITRQFLREIPQPMSSKLQLDFPDESLNNLAKHARRMEEVLYRTQTPTENVSTVTSAESTESKLEALRTEFKELKNYSPRSGSTGTSRGGTCCGFPPSNLRIAPSDPLLPTSHLDDVIHVDPLLTCKEIVIVDPPSEAGAGPVGEVTPTTVRHEPPMPSLVSIVVGWATLLASAPPL